MREICIPVERKPRVLVGAYFFLAAPFGLSLGAAAAAFAGAAAFATGFAGAFAGALAGALAGAAFVTTFFSAAIMYQVWFVPPFVRRSILTPLRCELSRPGRGVRKRLFSKDVLRSARSPSHSEFGKVRHHSYFQNIRHSELEKIR